MNLHPTDDRVIIERDEASKTLIIIPGAPEKATRGIIKAVGPGRQLESGERVPVDYNVGDHVVFGAYSGVDIEDGEDTYLIMKGEEILAVVGG